MPIDHATARPISTLLSGPASGVVATLAPDAQVRHRPRRSSMDIGGTSADFCVLEAATSRTPGTRRSTACRSRCRVSTSPRSAPAAARSPMPTISACCRSGRTAQAPIPGPPPTAAAAREPTLTDAYLVSRSHRSRATSSAARSRSTSRPRADAIGELAARLRARRARDGERHHPGRHLEPDGRVHPACGEEGHRPARLRADPVRRRGSDARLPARRRAAHAAHRDSLLARDVLRDRLGRSPTSASTTCERLRVAREGRPGGGRRMGRRDRGARRAIRCARHSPMSPRRKRRAPPTCAIVGQGFEVAVPFDEACRVAEPLSQPSTSKLYGPRPDEAPVEVINLRATVVGVTRKQSLEWTGEARRAPSRGTAGSTSSAASTTVPSIPAAACRPDGGPTDRSWSTSPTRPAS